MEIIEGSTQVLQAEIGRAELSELAVPGDASPNAS
jgi:hypothetical protein